MSTEVLRAQIEYFKRAHLSHKKREGHHARQAILLAKHILVAEARLRIATELEKTQHIDLPTQQTGQ